ncbi:ion transporter [Clostridium felsineum]|uniref:ion transporter n=1 Tax=Clostridium felsineum TaxID=36839 RepID=UPI00214D422D|nr:ion transporter [Clostridium felsineum]MCR3760281.1 ion transporter [Clostridium felsineum]
MNIIKHKKIIYNLISSLLALIASIMIIIELSFDLPHKIIYIFNIADNIILIIFAIDYFVRLYMSENKKKFFKENIIDLISIIPFNAIFQGFRLLRALKFLKLLRVFSLLLRFRKYFPKFIKTNNFHYVIYITIFVFLVGTLGMHFTEKLSYENALWWSFVTLTNIGYGNISPSTTPGRILAGILMLVGIGFLSMLTGTISTFFITKQTKTSYKNEVIENIKSKLDDFDKLTDEDLNDIYKILKSLKNKD